MTIGSHRRSGTRPTLAAAVTRSRVERPCGVSQSQRSPEKSGSRKK